MLRFTLLKIPITIEPLFWLLAVLISWPRGASAQDLPAIQMAISRVGVVLISILSHELGHALSARAFGSQQSITLHALGGVAQGRLPNDSRLHNFLTVLAGPIVTFVLAYLAYFALNLEQSQNFTFVAKDALRWMTLVNIFWGIFNILPIMPMDGGQLLYYAFFVKKPKIIFTISTIFAAFATLYAFKMGQIFIAVFLGYLAYQNFKAAKGVGLPKIW